MVAKLHIFYLHEPKDTKMSEPTFARELYHDMCDTVCIFYIEITNKKLIFFNIHTFNGFPPSRLLELHWTERCPHIAESQQDPVLREWHTNWGFHLFRIGIGLEMGEDI